MSSLKGAYLNELYKISKKKKITVAIILFTLSVVIAAAIVFSINNFAGIRVTGSSEFSLLVLSVLNYTLIPLFTAFICIDMFSGEYVDQTMKLTLTTPATRLMVFVGKALAAATFIMANLLFVMLLSIIASLFLNGTSLGLMKIILSYLLSFFPIFVFALVVIVISNLTKGIASAFTLSVLVFLLFIGLRFVFPNFQSFLFTSAIDWYRLFLGSYVNFSKALRVFLILSGYGIMLFGLGYYLFEKKDL